jgi:hypothetical protein
MSMGVTCPPLDTPNFHRPSRTLPVADLIENFGPAELRHAFARLLD